MRIVRELLAGLSAGIRAGQRRRGRGALPRHRRPGRQSRVPAVGRAPAPDPPAGPDAVPTRPCAPGVAVSARLANPGWTGWPATGDGQNRRPEPDTGMLVGALAASVGYLLPWFRQGGGWSYSGWGYAGLGAGGAWTLATLGWLALAVGGALWARRSVTAAMVGMAGVVGALFFAVAVVAAGVAARPQGDSLDDAGGLPFGVGLPLMAAGFGWAVAASCRAIVVGSRPRAGAAVATDPPR